MIIPATAHLGRERWRCEFLAAGGGGGGGESGGGGDGECGGVGGGESGGGGEDSDEHWSSSAGTFRLLPPHGLYFFQTKATERSEETKLLSTEALCG